MAGRSGTLLPSSGTNVSRWFVMLKADMRSLETVCRTPSNASTAEVHQSSLFCSNCPGFRLLNEIGKRPSATASPYRFHAIAFAPVVLESMPTTRSSELFMECGALVINNQYSLISNWGCANTEYCLPIIFLIGFDRFQNPECCLIV